MLELLRYKFGERISHWLRFILIGLLLITVAAVATGMIYEFRGEVRRAESLLQVPHTNGAAE